MIRRAWALLASAMLLAALASASIAGPASADPPFRCDGPQDPGLTINGKLVVPYDTFCMMYGATVKGRVVIKDEGSLCLHDSTVHGSIYVGGYDACIGGSTVNGSIQCAPGGIVSLGGDATVTGSIGKNCVVKP